MTLGEVAYKEIEAFKNGTVQLTDGDSFSQYQNIRRINRYKAGKFWDCPDVNALFWQLATPRIPLYAKSIDLDTKDFRMIGIGKFNWFKAWILNVRFKKWARENRLSITLDDTADGISTYGSMVWKKSYDSDGEVRLDLVNLQNLSFDQTVKNIIDSPVAETHFMTEMEIRKRYPEQAKEAIEKAERARDNEGNDAESEDERYMVIERWGEHKEEEQDVPVYKHIIVIGQGDAEVVLVDDDIKIGSDGKPKEFPYFDFHGERVPGRWQALGVVERLFPITEQANKLVNQNDDANDIASLLLFRTNDPKTKGNILDSVRTGQIVNSEDMQQLGIDNRFISTFINQLQLIEQKADSLCYINDSISGDTPPSGVPFRSLAVATKAAKSTFRYIKTSIGEKMGFVLQEQIMPDQVKKFGREELIDIMEEDADLRFYDEIVADREIREWMKGKAMVFEEDIEAKREEVKERLRREGRQEKMPKFDFKWGIYMNPTGESVDKNTQNAAIDGALADMAANPAIVNTPLYQQKLENNGIASFRLSKQEEAKLTQTQGQPLPAPPQVDKLSQLADIG